MPPGADYKLLGGVIGQKRARAQLEAEMATGSLAHAYLFVGPAGVGRATTARALFAALICSGHGPRACGQCGPCRRAQSGRHEELLILEPPSAAPSAQIKVELVREVIRAMGFAPLGGWRLVLIKEADHLNLSSANALLKTLEEPPPGNILVLTVQDPGELLPTLVSRCRKVSFVPLPLALVSQELQARGEDPAAARLKAALAGGSLGRALELEQEELTADLDRLRRQMEGPGGLAEDLAFAEELVGRYKSAGRLDRRGLAEALGVLGLFFRDQAVAAAKRPGLAALPSPQPAADLGWAVRSFGQVRRAQKDILANASPELVVGLLLSELRQRAA